MILYSIVPPEIVFGNFDWCENQKQNYIEVGLLRRESSCHAPVKQPIYDKQGYQHFTKSFFEPETNAGKYNYRNVLNLYV